MKRTVPAFFHRLALVFCLFLGAVASPPRATAAGALAPSPLVSVDWLAGHLGRSDLVVIDMRGAASFNASHIPGAINSVYPGAWRTERDGVPWVLPQVAALESYLSNLGVGNDKTVVFVPEGKDATELGDATWPYWVLKYLGHNAVSILDGGWNAWKADPARAVENGPSRPKPAEFSAAVDPSILISTREVASKLGSRAALIDARPPSQYLGETKSGLAVRAGRIPGAVNIPSASLFDADAGRLKSRDALAAIAAPILPDPDQEIITYCNTGHWSSIDWFALHEVLGYSRVELYEESMAGWTRDASLPVETGPAAR